LARLAEAGAMYRSGAFRFPRLSRKSVLVWVHRGRPLKELSLDTSLLETSLSSEETILLEGMSPDQRRHSSSRWAKRREVLAHYVQCSPEEVRLKRTRCGKPEIERPRGLHFNAAHSGCTHALAVAESRVGLDLEILDDLDESEVEDAAEFVLSDDELSTLRALPRAQWRRYYLRAWTRREAFLKAVGEGLSHADLPELVVPAGGTVYVPQSPLRGRWLVCEREPFPGVLIAVVSELPVERLIINNF
jgi:phosphopantetheinyl transferase